MANSNSNSNSPEQIVAHLKESVGVKPCDEWLQACLAFLRETNKPITADEVLYQILHTDLRDVVRETTIGDNDNDNGNSNVTQLEQALSRSTQSQSSKQQLSLEQESSCSSLLCQVEELLDVSKNAETRLAHGPADAHAPTPVGNQRNRCLKLCLSHGHLPTNNTSTLSSLIAMEVTPISNLSTNTLAGCKLLLHGTITIRWGVLMLHPGNTTVLGGSVQELVHIQKQALEQAKQVAGVGVDPTVRALIGTNPITTEDDENDPQDEAEEESRDVPLQAAPVFNPNTANANANPNTTTTTRSQPPPQVNHNHNQIRNAPMPPPTNRQPTMMGNNSTTSRSTSHSTMSTTTTALPSSRPTNPYGASTNTTASSSSLTPPPSTTTTTAALHHRPTPTVNPYGGGGGGGGSGSQSSASTANMTSSAATNALTPRPNNRASLGNNKNPYGGSSSNAASSSASARIPNSSTTSSISNTNRMAVNPYGGGGGSASVSSAAALNPYATSQSQSAMMISSAHPNSASFNNPRLSTGTVNSSSNRTETVDLTQSRSPSPTSPQPQPHMPSSTTRSVPSTHYNHASYSSSATPMDIVESSVSPAFTESTRAASTISPLATPNVQTNMNTNISTTTSVQHMAFANLQKLLQQLVQNQEMYESYRNSLNMAFRVKLTKKGGQMHFNIEKNRNYSKKSKEKNSQKYELIIHATFGMPGDTGVVACKLSSALIEPYFEKSPSELRALSRTNREESQRIAAEGGKRVADEYFSERYWKATLYPTSDQVFGPSSASQESYSLGNVHTPMLLLEPEE